jgi:hypothetical protein
VFWPESEIDVFKYSSGQKVSDFSEVSDIGAPRHNCGAKPLAA